jgi:Ser/Thr protein kinase RdoA (MazF antagonist)
MVVKRRRVGKGALALCPPMKNSTCMVGMLRFAHPTTTESDEMTSTTTPSSGAPLMQQLGELLDTASPPAATDEIEALARDAFGLDVRATPLTGERDRNFHLVDRDNRQFVLKVIHPAEAPDVTDLQSRLLLHVEVAAPDLAVPRLVRPRDGDGLEFAWLVDGQPPRRVRCLTYLAGRPLHQATSSIAQRRNLGGFLARLDLALADFRHPADGHDLLWDIKSAPRARALLADLAHPQKRALAEAALDRFSEYVTPMLPSLRAQVIHNDFNPHNVLADAIADDVISGVIDFGDVVRAPLVQDLAVAAAYQVGADGHPLQGAADMASRFHAICPLRPEEIELLPDMIAARLALTIAVSSWRAARHPDNADYILRNQVTAWNGLQRLQDISRDNAIVWLRGQIEAR